MCEEVRGMCEEGTQKVCSKGVWKVWETCSYFGNPTIKVWLESEEGFLTPPFDVLRTFLSFI